MAEFIKSIKGQWRNSIYKKIQNNFKNLTEYNTLQGANTDEKYLVYYIRKKMITKMT